VVVSAAGAMSLKRSFSSLDLAADARAARARRSDLRRRAQPSNKEGLEDPTLETPLKDTGLPPSPPAPPIDGRTLFDLEVALTIATTMKAEAEAQEAQNATTMKAEAEVSPEGLATLAQLLADKTTTDNATLAQLLADKTTTDKCSNDLGPVALPRIGKEERFSPPCPRRRQAGRRAGPHQYLSKPFHCGCCMGTCELCDPTKDPWSPSYAMLE